MWAAGDVHQCVRATDEMRGTMPPHTVIFHLHGRTPSSKETALVRMLEKKYAETDAIDVLLPLVERSSPVSLRALDWCVTNWSKQHNVVCTGIAAGRLTNIHHSYRAMLSFWKRRLFDPFRRRERVDIEIDGTRHETTLGQANFALWAHTSGTYAYVVGHCGEIERSMNAISHSQKLERKKARERGVRRRRCELTSAPKSLCVTYRAPCRVTFDDEDV